MPLSNLSLDADTNISSLNINGGTTLGLGSASLEGSSYVTGTSGSYDGSYSPEFNTNPLSSISLDYKGEWVGICYRYFDREILR